ncbi:hypothetical protein [Nostoc sp. C110]
MTIKLEDKKIAFDQPSYLSDRILSQNGERDRTKLSFIHERSQDY